MRGWRRAARGLRARRFAALALLFTAAVTVAAASLGPLYARAAQESVLQDTLTGAAVNRTGLQVAAATDLSQRSNREAPGLQAPAAGVLGVYPTRVTGLRADAGITADASTVLPQVTRLVARDGVCDHVTVVAGRCPAAAGEAMVSARAAAGGYGLRPGVAATVCAALCNGSGATTQVTVVGTYRPDDPDDAYWFGRAYFNAAVSYADEVGDTVDAVFVTPDTFGRFTEIAGAVELDYPLAPDRLRLVDRAAVGAGVRALLQTPHPGVIVSDDLPAVLAGADTAGRDVARGSLLVSLQLGVLALVVLFVTTSDALDARGGDVALARLRGLTPAATARLLLGESLLVFALAVPAGVAAALLATHLLAAAVLVPGVPVAVPATAWAGAGVAFLGAVAAGALAGRRVLRRSVLDEWRGARRRPGGGRWTLAAEVVLAAAALVGVGLLLRGGGGVALLGPGLLVVAVALLGTRLVPVLVRRAVPRTAGSQRLGRFLALRQVARRPAALRLGALLAVAIGLAVFAVGGESVAAGNRRARAEVQTGAPRTVAVQFATGADPTALVAAADPDGRWAMAAATWLPAGGQTVAGAVQALDPTRLAAVAYPTTDGPSLAVIAHDLAPDPAPVIALRATAASLTVVTTDLTGDPPWVDLLLGRPGMPDTDVRLGRLQAGTAVYTADVPCDAGCTLRGIGWERPASSFDPIGATVRVTGLSATDAAGASAPVSLGLDHPAGWRSRSPDATDSQAQGRVEVSDGAVVETFRSTGGGSAGLAHAVGPSPLPVWAGVGAVNVPPEAADGSAGVPAVVDTFGNAYPVRVVGTTAVLPGVAPDGVLADARALADQLPGFTGEARWSVWLGAAAPADALDRLRAAGLATGTVTSEADLLARLGRQGPALALALLLACAVAAAALATGATATAIATSGRRRAFELAALRVLGVPRGALTRSAVLEQGLLLGAAAVLGVPAGVLAAVLAMPVVPQFSDTSPLPLRTVPDPVPLAVLAGVLLVLLGTTALVAGRVLVRAAVPGRLREADR